jgi:predicted AlkP superfamily phosphohydrolase/phosphomutase
MEHCCRTQSAHRASPARLLIIGLDGATLDLIEPWATAGDLPHLGRLMQKGAWGPLHSTLPPMTFPAWSTMMTGVNPGRHGIFDFTRRLPGRYAVEFVNSTHRRYPTLWRRLSDMGCRVGVMGVPTTYPPEPVNGFLLAGFDAPVTTGIDASFVYPPHLLDEIRTVAEYRITDFQELHIGPGWHAEALDNLQKAISDRCAIAKHLLTRQEWDCFMVLFGESDTVSHHFWAFHDPASPRHVDGAAKISTGIRTIYRQLDQAIGELLAAAPSATVMVLSDHGFGGTGDKIIYLNRWLAGQGYLCFDRGPGLVDQVIRTGKRMGLRLLPSAWQEQVFRRGGGWLANRVESNSRFAGIDWTATQAFSEESNSCPAIWLNVAGREVGGIVAPEDYDSVRSALIAQLEDWRDPWTGRAIVHRAWRREELYSGPYVEEAPDIVLELALDTTDGGQIASGRHSYAYTCQSSQGRPGPALRRLSRSEYLGAKGQSMNGSHRPQGVLIMAGPGIRPARLVNAHLADIAPTVLALLQPAGADAIHIQDKIRAADAIRTADGRVLSEALENAEPFGAPVERTAPVAPGAAEVPIRAYTPAEAQVVQKRLRSLGYLE